MLRKRSSVMKIVPGKAKNQNQAALPNVFLQSCPEKWAKLLIIQNEKVAEITNIHNEFVTFDGGNITCTPYFKERFMSHVQNT